MRRSLPHIIASAIVCLAAHLLPTEQRPWGVAMRHEVRSIGDAGGALAFAIGCLGFAVRRALQSQGWNDRIMTFAQPVFRNPKWMLALCAGASTALGLAYMSAAGAPAVYLTINLGALVLGLIMAGTLAAVARSWRPAPGSLCMVLALSILLTALSGLTAEGAARWIAVGRLAVQTSLLVLPVLVIAFARSRDTLSTVAIAVAALALAIQPDRAMAGALMAAMGALAFVRPERNVTIALGAAMIGFMATLLQPETLTAVPFVDRILITAFAIHPFMGVAVMGGSALLIVPAIVGWRFDRDYRDVYVVFGAVWLAIIAAAAIGNFPTPLVGYGGSAIMGYVLCLLGLPTCAAAPDMAPPSRDAPESERPQTTPRAAYGL